MPFRNEQDTHASARLSRLVGPPELTGNYVVYVERGLLFVEQGRQPLLNPVRQPQARQVVGHFKFRVNGLRHTG
jgi:hypothetical protein